MNITSKLGGKMFKNKFKALIVLNILAAIYLIFIKGNLSGNVSTLKVIFLFMGIIPIMLFIPDIIEIKYKFKNFNNILLVIEQNRISKYLMLAFASFTLAFFSFYLKSLYSFSLGLMLIAMSLFFFSRHKSKYYLSNAGVFWAGLIFAWKDVSSLEFNKKKSMIVISFRVTPEWIY